MPQIGRFTAAFKEDGRVLVDAAVMRKDYCGVWSDDTRMTLFGVNMKRWLERNEYRGVETARLSRGDCVCFALTVTRQTTVHVCSDFARLRIARLRDSDEREGGVEKMRVVRGEMWSAQWSSC